MSKLNIELPVYLKLAVIARNPSILGQFAGVAGTIERSFVDGQVQRALVRWSNLGTCNWFRVDELSNQKPRPARGTYR